MTTDFGFEKVLKEFTQASFAATKLL